MEAKVITSIQLREGFHMVIYFSPSTSYRYFLHGTQFMFEIGDEVPPTFQELSHPIETGDWR